MNRRAEPPPPDPRPEDRRPDAALGESPETATNADGRPAPTPEQEEEARRALKTGGQESI